MANSKIYLGSTNIGSFFQGADDISIYLGDEKVYPLGEPTLKWKATYQDSHVESAECDSSSAITEGEMDKTNLVSVEIGDCVTSIDSNAFEGCYSLTSIDIPNSVTTIGENAFSHCESLTSIDIPSGVRTIGSNTFFYCTGLTSITVNATTPPTLGSEAFYGTTCPIYVPCESVEAYKSASDWRNYASRIQCIQPPFEGKFKALYSGGQTYELACDGNATLTTINTKPSGYEFSAMTEAIIGDCVTIVNGRILWGCTSLTSCTIPSGVTSIGNYAFENCTSLTSIDIPSGVTTINDGTFERCSSLTSIDIPSGVTSIGNEAFNSCSGLISIDIPSGVTSISGGAFADCSGLTSVTVNATTPPTLDGNFVFYNTNDCPIYVPSGSVSAYQSAWSDYSSRIQAIPNS